MPKAAENAVDMGALTAMIQNENLSSEVSMIINQRLFLSARAAEFLAWPSGVDESI